MTQQEKVDWLFDRAQITEVVHRYAIGIDSRDWNMFRSIFADEIEVWLGFATDPRRDELHRRDADRFTESVKRTISQFAVTQHFFTDYSIEVTGGTAVCVCYMQARHFNPSGADGQAWDIGGYYTYHLGRTAAGWKISKYTLTLTWEQNRPAGVRL